MPHNVRKPRMTLKAFYKDGRHKNPIVGRTLKVFYQDATHTISILRRTLSAFDEATSYKVPRLGPSLKAFCLCLVRNEENTIPMLYRDTIKVLELLGHQALLIPNQPDTTSQKRG